METNTTTGHFVDPKGRTRCLSELGEGLFLSMMTDNGIPGDEEDPDTIKMTINLFEPATLAEFDKMVVSMEILNAFLIGCNPREMESAVRGLTRFINLLRYNKVEKVMGATLEFQKNQRNFQLTVENYFMNIPLRK